MKRPLGLMIFALLLAGCATKPQNDLSAFRAANPRSILVVPVVNKSLDVDAPTYMLSTLPVPLAEKGYYVFPVNTTKFVLEQEGFYEGERVQQQPPEVLAKLFGADAVLFVTINQWDAQYILLSTTVTVDFDYRLVGKDGTELWKTRQVMKYSPQSTNTGNLIGNLVAAAIQAAVARARPNYMPLTRQANNQAFAAGNNPIPDGPYASPK
ncbi:MAG TPA: GNA1162 family protein [Burkholderiaceae bacterium]|nr:GNA1162 family protein [Burkholderiaceae bacterium]